MLTVHQIEERNGVMLNDNDSEHKELGEYTDYIPWICCFPHLYEWFISKVELC